MSKQIGALANQPDNLDALQQNKFRFTLRRLPHVNYFCREATLPSLDISSSSIPTPFRQSPFPEVKLTYEQTFNITFTVDEDLKNYLEIHDWMVGLGFPDNFGQYKRLVEEQSDTIHIRNQGHPWSDATLIIQTNHQNKNLEVAFESCFPVSLSGLTFTSRIDSIEHIDATASFRYSKYRFVL